MKEFSLILNWFGMAVHDVPAATDFYGRILGFSYEVNETHGLWRQFQTKQMTFELFQAHLNRHHVTAWGQGQAFRPVMVVSDLSEMAGYLQKHTIPISRTESEVTALEITGPEGIRWGLQESPTIQMDWSHPLIAGIELKAANFNAQKDLYTQVLGLTLEDETGQGIHLSQSIGEAWLHIEAGGMETLPPKSERPAFFYPIWISFETNFVKQANAWLQHQGVTILRPLTYHPDWLGTDILLADADGNVIQVVQYGKVENIAESAY